MRNFNQARKPKIAITQSILHFSLLKDTVLSLVFIPSLHIMLGVIDKITKELDAQWGDKKLLEWLRSHSILQKKQELEGGESEY